MGGGVGVWVCKWLFVCVVMEDVAVCLLVCTFLWAVPRRCMHTTPIDILYQCGFIPTLRIV